MSFTTYIPCDELKPYVSQFAISEATAGSSYKVLPGTGLVIGFQYQGRLSYINAGKKMPLTTSGITGLHDRYRLYTNLTNTGSVLVYFKEAGAAPFFRQPIHELFDKSVSLDHFMLRSELLMMEEQLCEAKTDRERIAVVENFLIARMNPALRDNLVIAALSIIHKNKGNLRITELMEQLNISQSPLEKRFRQVVGASPKKFASVVRFKYILQQHSPQSQLMDLAYEAGFYDQSHFIKEFRTFTGETPEAFFRME